MSPLGVVSGPHLYGSGPSWDSPAGSGLDSASLWLPSEVMAEAAGRGNPLRPGSSVVVRRVSLLQTPAPAQAFPFVC